MFALNGSETEIRCQHQLLLLPLHEVHFYAQDLAAEVPGVQAHTKCAVDRDLDIYILYVVSKHNRVIISKNTRFHLQFPPNLYRTTLNMTQGAAC